MMAATFHAGMNSENKLKIYERIAKAAISGNAGRTTALAVSVYRVKKNIGLS